MNLQHKWGRAGTALAFMAAVCVDGLAGAAQNTPYTLTPPPNGLVSDRALPAPRVEVVDDFTAGTTGQTADAVERVAIADRAFSFNLNNPVMGHTDGAGNVVGQLPAGENVLTLTQVVLYDIAEMGEASLSRANLPTLAVYNGETLLGTANYATEATEAAPEVAVNLADGSTATLRPVVYAFTEPVSVNATTTYTLRLNAAGVTPVLPLFANATSDAGFGILNYEIWAPYVTFVCQGSVNVETFTVSEDSALSALGTYTDGASTALVFTLAEGVTLTLDKRVQNATLIFETTAPAASAPTVAFAENVAFSTPFVFRNAEGSDNGAIRVSGPWQDSSDNDSNTTWDPAALTVDCDLILASPLPFRGGNWFQDNDVRVLPGRTLRLETEADTAKRLPDVLLTAPSANLALADAEKNGDIPEKYLPLFDTTSGTVTLERPVAFGNHSNTSNDSQGSIFRIGNDEGKGYNFTLNVDKDFSSASRLVIGGDSGATTLNLRGEAATTYAATINFDSNSTLIQRAGQLTLGGDGWATWFLGDSATLVFGDGDHQNGTATATLYGIPYGSSTGAVTTDYRGAADLTVSADATLVLNKTVAVDKSVDYALYPAGKRSLKVRGGTVKANTGAAVTMAFESPEPQAAPMAVAEIPGLEVIGAANLESSDTVNSSLSLDALKGNGTVSIKGRVTIGSAIVQEGTTLTFDNDPDPLITSAGTIEAVSGTGTVIFGKLGDAGTTGVQKVADALEAGNFTGTLSFLVGTGSSIQEEDYPEVDFAATDVPRLPYTLAVQPGQTLVMRLDQYADSKILWPEDCSEVTLILVEAGPFGGEATIPAWPEDVTFEFHRYDTADGIPGAADTHKDLDEFYPGALFDPYEVFPNVNQGTVDLTWEEPVLSGKVAWLDMEFNGNSKNTGWFSLGDEDQNGMLRGAAGSLGAGSEGELIPDSAQAYDTTHNPQSKGINIDYKPYIAPASFSLPEEQWSLVTRIMMPEYSNMSVLTIGANYDDTTGDSGATYETDGYSVLALAVGALKDDRRNNDAEGDELILWYIPKNSTEGMVELATATVPCITESQHLVSILFDRGLVEVWLNGNRLIRTQLPAGAKIGPGLQVGSLMGGENLNSALKETILGIETKGTNPSDPGTVDFIRVYNGLLSEAALNALVCDYPYIHKEAGDLSENIWDIRYVRELNGGTVLWAPTDGSKPWKRQYKAANRWWLDSGSVDSGNEDDYAEPAEGAIIVLNCTRDTTIYVNTKKGGLFPSADRTYAQLIVEGGARVTIRPYDDANTEMLDWETAKDEDGNYLYGRLYFSGGADEAVAQHATDEATDSNRSGSGSAAACFVHDAILYASVCDLSRDAVRLFHTESFFDEHTARLQMFADEARMRGETRDVVECHLTGQVSGQGYLEITPDTSLNPDYEQVSTHVYVQNFIPSTSEWLITDTTETNEHNSSFTSSGGSLNVGKGGLYARYAKYPGPLYLELNVDQLGEGEGNLADQEWYSFGYHGDKAAETRSRLAPEKPKSANAFEEASALYIRLKDGDTDDVLRVSADKRIADLTVEAPKTDDEATTESLRILPSQDDKRLTVTDSVTTARRLEVYDVEANAGATGEGVDGIQLEPREEIVGDTESGTTTVIETGTLLHGVGQGAFVAGNTKVEYPLDGSSIARIESVGTVRFTAAQDLSATTVAAAEGATLEQTGVATETATAEQVGADNAFRAKAMELAQGSRFRFASSAATVDEGISFLGAATLEGTGTAATLTPTAGLVAGEVESAKAILDAKESASWKLLNREVDGLPLTKVGAGTADIATDLPPNAGFVDVQEGTLAVATGLAGEGQAVGQASLNVAADATLAPTSGTIAEDVLAEIPAGQIVSGLGRIAGTLRLETDATLDATTVPATNDASLSVRDVQTDGQTALADVNVALPEQTHEGLVFLRSDETELNWAARARLLAVDPTPTRWDVLLRYRPNPEVPEGTNYLVGAAGLSVPDFDGIPDDIPEGDRPSQEEADENNKWPEGTEDTPAVNDEVTDQIQGGGNVAGEAEGYTMANHKWLMAPDIANAYACFGNVWTIAPRALDPQSEDYATRDLLMAYEFGISRMAFSKDGKSLVVEVTLRNALAACPYFTEAQLQGADKLTPTFLPGVQVALSGPEGVIADAQELSAEQAAEAGLVPSVPANETARWFLVPYDEDHFPAGVATGLTVRAIPPASEK